MSVGGTVFYLGYVGWIIQRAPVQGYVNTLYERIFHSKVCSIYCAKQR